MPFLPPNQQRQSTEGINDDYRRGLKFKNKSVFSYIHRLKTRHCPHLLLHAVLRPRAAVVLVMQQSIDISYLLGPQQQTRRMLLQQANGTDRRMDNVLFQQTLLRML